MILAIQKNHPTLSIYKSCKRRICSIIRGPNNHLTTTAGIDTHSAEDAARRSLSSLATDRLLLSPRMSEWRVCRCGLHMCFGDLAES